MELPQEEEAAQREREREREREIPVSPFVLRTHRILACRQPSVARERERERESTFSFRGSRTTFKLTSNSLTHIEVGF